MTNQYKITPGSTWFLLQQYSEQGNYIPETAKLEALTMQRTFAIKYAEFAEIAGQTRSYPEVNVFVDFSTQFKKD